MTLILVREGMLRSLDELTAAWAGNRFIGLMSSSGPVERLWTMALVVKAVFSGYTGEQAIQGWKPAVLSGEYATTTATPNIWTHTGGPASCAIAGYYVVDQNGKLMWAETFSAPYQIMAANGDTASVTPMFVLGSRFPYP